MKKYINFTQFNKNVIYFQSLKWGFGCVWRRKNLPQNRVGWIKIVWNNEWDCYSYKVVSDGWNIFRAIKELRKEWNPNLEF